MSAVIKIAGKAAVIGPDDVLVIHVTGTHDDDTIAGWRRHLHERLGDRFVLIGGDDVEITKVAGA